LPTAGKGDEPVEIKIVALFAKREKKGLTTTFYSERIGKKVFNDWEEAMAHAATVYKRMSSADRQQIVHFSYRDATEEEIREAKE
jgi:hypothetical protein